MFNFKKRPKTKKLEQFELLEINLIKDSPLDFAYVMHKSNRVIQKESKESLMEMVLKDPYSAEYLKLGPERDFELTESIPELKEVFRKRVRDGIISNLFFVLLILLAVFYFNEKIEDLVTPFGITLITYILGTTAFQFYKLSKFRKLHNEKL